MSESLVDDTKYLDMFRTMADPQPIETLLADRLGKEMAARYDTSLTFNNNLFIYSGSTLTYSIPIPLTTTTTTDTNGWVYVDGGGISPVKINSDFEDRISILEAGIEGVNTKVFFAREEIAKNTKKIRKILAEYTMKDLIDTKNGEFSISFRGRLELQSLRRKARTRPVAW